MIGVEVELEGRVLLEMEREEGGRGREIEAGVGVSEEDVCCFAPAPVRGEGLADMVARLTQTLWKIVFGQTSFKRFE